MKNLFILKILGGLFISTFFWGCQTSNEYTYTANVPVYMEFDEFRNSFKTSSAQGIQQAGKIYLRGDYLFVNEVNKGIHVINNADPSNPHEEIFYEIPGNVDMAIYGNILLADSYIDLVAIDISDLYNPVEVGRLENAFPLVTAFPEDDSYPLGMIDYTRGVIVGWEVCEVTDTYPDDYSGGWWGNGNFYMMAEGSGSDNGSQSGIGGSMARFMLHQNYLYTVTNPWLLKTLDIADATQMVAVDSLFLGREMETLFRLEENLFIGTTSGMMILDISDPAVPLFVSDFDHANACDPVVVENDIAYVTLRSGNNCNSFSNQLDVVDIEDLQNPRLLKSYPMFNPHGLGIDQGVLFICDGADGLKIYDTSNPLAIQSNMIVHFPGIDTYDVIPYNEVLMLIGHDGLFQYDYSDLQDIRLLSHIPISAP